MIGFLILMAFWSHTLAKKPYNPGFVEWNHFKSDVELLLNKDDE